MDHLKSSQIKHLFELSCLSHMSVISRELSCLSHMSVISPDFPLELTRFFPGMHLIRFLRIFRVGISFSINAV